MWVFAGGVTLAVSERQHSRAIWSETNSRHDWTKFIREKYAPVYQGFDHVVRENNYRSRFIRNHRFIDIRRKLGRSGAAGILSTS
jgi:hypothetical protein